MSYEISYNQIAVFFPVETEFGLDLNSHKHGYILLEVIGSSNFYDFDDKRVRSLYTVGMGLQSFWSNYIKRSVPHVDSGCLQIYGNKRAKGHSYVKRWQNRLKDALPLDFFLRLNCQETISFRVNKSVLSGDALAIKEMCQLVQLKQKAIDSKWLTDDDQQYYVSLSIDSASTIALLFELASLNTNRPFFGEMSSGSGELEKYTPSKMWQQWIPLNDRDKCDFTPPTRENAFYKPSVQKSYACEPFSTTNNQNTEQLGFAF
jgi:hypothetical protein